MRPSAWGSRWLPGGIRRRLYLLIALAMVPALVLLGWVYYQRYRGRRAEALQTELEVARGVATTLTTYMDGLQCHLETVGTAIILLSPYQDGKAEFLFTAVLERYPAIRSMNWVSPDGTVLASSLPDNVGRDVSGLPHFRKILANQPWAMGDLTENEPVFDDPAVALSTAIRDNSGVLRGVVMASIEAAKLGKLMLTQERPAGGTYTIFDRQGVVVFCHSHEALTWEQRLDWRQGDSVLRRVMETGQAHLGVIPLEVLGDRWILARVPITSIGWVAGAARPVDIALAPVWRGLLQDASLGLVIVLLAFGLAYLLARTIAEPLRRLERDAQAMGKGRVNVPGDVEAPAEVQSLRNTVAAMACALIHRAEALQQSEERFRTLVTVTPVILWTADREGSVTLMSPQYGAFTGLPAGAGVEWSWQRAVHPEDVERITRAWSESVTAGQPYQTQFRLRDASGGYRWFTVHAEPVRNAQGHIVEWFGASIEIDAQKRAEEALRESERRYRKLFEANLAGVYLTKPDGTILHFNDAMMKMLGYDSREEVFQHRSSDFYADPEFRNELMRLLREDGIVPAKEAVLKRKDGSDLNALGAAVLLTDEQTGEQYIQGVAVDITERKRAEEALQRSQAILAQAGQMASLGAWDIEVRNPEDITGNPLHWSDQVYRIFGYEPGSVEATNDLFFRHVHPDDRQQVGHALARALAEKQPYEIEHRVIRRDGAERTVLEHAEIRLDDQGRPRQMIGAVQDITLRKRTEESLRDLTATLETKVAQRTEELEHRTRQLQRLALELSQAEERERKRLAEILHDDLQQQLAAVKYHLGMLSSRIKPDAALREMTVRLDVMIKDAIEKSRRLSRDLSPAVLYHGGLGEALDWLADQIQAKHGLIVHVAVDGEAAAQSETLKTFLYRATQEMLFNVVKHARIKEARIRARRRGEYLCLSVSDRGRGFDPQELEAASGLGLRNIRERVQLLGGRMRIKSARGKGTTLFLAIPDREPILEPRWPMPDREAGAAAAAGPQPALHAPPGRPREARLRVLLAEDHKIVRQGLAALLSEEDDIEIVGEAANGREAIDETHRLQPDIVIMDVSMPLMDGDEATRQIKRYVPRTRVIALTMWAEPEVADRMSRAGAEACVLKTAPAEELLAVIRGSHADAQA